MVAGTSNKEIMKARNLPERTFYDYQHRLQDRIANTLMQKNNEEILLHKEICREQLIDSMKVEYELSHNDKISPRTRMDAAFRKGELAVAVFKLEGETTNWLMAYRQLQLEKPKTIQPYLPPDPYDSLADARSSDADGVDT
jgi:hypothetical protein